MVFFFKRRNVHTVTFADERRSTGYIRFSPIYHPLGKFLLCNSTSFCSSYKTNSTNTTISSDQVSSLSQTLLLPFPRGYMWQRGEVRTHLVVGRRRNFHPTPFWGTRWTSYRPQASFFCFDECVYQKQTVTYTYCIAWSRSKGNFRFTHARTPNSFSIDHNAVEVVRVSK